jgi:hypothetical protein
VPESGFLKAENQNGIRPKRENTIFFKPPRKINAMRTESRKPPHKCKNGVEMDF